MCGRGWLFLWRPQGEVQQLHQSLHLHWHRHLHLHLHSHWYRHQHLHLHWPRHRHLHLYLHLYLHLHRHLHRHVYRHLHLHLYLHLYLHLFLLLHLRLHLHLQGECLLPNLLGKFYDQQQHCDVSFQLQDGSTVQVNRLTTFSPSPFLVTRPSMTCIVQAHKLFLAVVSPVFEGMFFGPLADKHLREVRVEDVKPAGFRRLLHFVYNSRCLSWKIEDAEEWWAVLEAAHKFLNARLVEQVERRLREVAKRDGGRGVILRHLNLANRMAGLASGVKSVFMNAVVKSTSKLLASEEWARLDQATALQVLDQYFLAATEGELYLAAKRWCLANTATEHEALRLFLDKFVQKITPEFMSQRDFLTCVANDAFLGQVDVFRDWTIKVMVRNTAEHTVRGSYRPMRVIQFYFNAQQKGNTPVQFKEEVRDIIHVPRFISRPLLWNDLNDRVLFALAPPLAQVATIEFQHETTRYTAAVTSVWDSGTPGLHLSLRWSGWWSWWPGWWSWW